MALKATTWNLSPARARELQMELAPQVVMENRCGALRRVAGVDVGFEQGGSVTRAAVAVLSYPSLKPIEAAVARRPTSFPYVPGLLSFRELPAVVEALHKLKSRPDLILCDRQGYAHPRRFGIACHLGVLENLPAIGVGKSRLIGTYAEPGPNRGSISPLLDHNEVIGAVVRTRTGVKPVFVSPGHLVDVPTAVQIVLACTYRYRLPETTRCAHSLASHGRWPRRVAGRKVNV